MSYNIYDVYADQFNYRRYEELVANELSEGEVFQYLLDLCESQIESEMLERELYENNAFEKYYLNVDLKFGMDTIIIVKESTKK